MYIFPEEMRIALESSAASFVYYQNINDRAVPVLGKVVPLFGYRFLTSQDDSFQDTNGGNFYIRRCAEEKYDEAKEWAASVVSQEKEMYNRR